MRLNCYVLKAISVLWLKKSRFHGKMDKIIDDLLLKGKEQLEEIRR